MPVQFRSVGGLFWCTCVSLILGQCIDGSQNSFAQQRANGIRSPRATGQTAGIESRTWNSRNVGGLIEGSCVGIDGDQARIVVGNLEYLVPLELFHPEDLDLLRAHFAFPANVPTQTKAEPANRAECQMLHTMRGGVFPEAKIVGHSGDTIHLTDVEGNLYRVPFYMFAEGVRGTVKDTITRLDGKPFLPKTQPEAIKQTGRSTARNSTPKASEKPSPASTSMATKDNDKTNQSVQTIMPPIAPSPPNANANPALPNSPVVELSAIGPERDWSMRGGKIKFRGRLLQVKPPYVEIQLTEGNKRQIPLELLEPRDRQFAESLAANGDVGEPPAGLPVFENESARFVCREGTPAFVLDGQKLIMLNGLGRTTGKKIELTEPFRLIYPQASHWIAATEKDIHLLDKDAFRTKKKIELWKYKRINDIAPHPSQPLYFVSVENVSDQVKRNPAENQKIVAVDLKSGDIEELDETYGMWVKMHPSGKFLLSGFHAAFQSGPNEELDITGRLVPRLNVEHVDVLNRYALSGRRLSLDEQFENAGTNGQGLAITPKGDRVCYLSFTGYPTYSYQINAFQSENFNARPVVFETKDRCDCKRIVFDSSGSFAASPTKDGAVIFDAQTGRVLEGLLTPSKELEGAIVLDLAFASDGRKLLFIASRAGSAPYLVESELDKK